MSTMFKFLCFVEVMRELAAARVSWLSSAPFAPPHDIMQALEDVRAKRIALAKAIRILDHKMGHPWLIGGPCACDPKEVRIPAQ